MVNTGSRSGKLPDALPSAPQLVLYRGGRYPTVSSVTEWPVLLATQT